jgi:hypothetical protein
MMLGEGATPPRVLTNERSTRVACGYLRTVRAIVRRAGRDDIRVTPVKGAAYAGAKTPTSRAGCEA